MNNLSHFEGKIAVSVAEAALMISLSKSFIRNEIREGKLKAKNVNRRVLILTSDLQTYLESKPDKTN